MLPLTERIERIPRISRTQRICINLILFHRPGESHFPYAPWPDFILDHADQHSG